MPVPSEVPSVAPGGGYTFDHIYRDILSRPFRGHVTIRRMDPPFMSAEADLGPDGGVTLRVSSPGRYVVSAMLRDSDNVRAFLTQEITFQEGS